MTSEDIKTVLCVLIFWAGITIIAALLVMDDYNTLTHQCLTQQV